MDRQIWIIAIDGPADEVSLLADELEERLLSASRNIEVEKVQRDDRVQGGWVDIIITAVGSGGVVTAIVGAIAIWIRMHHSISISIKIEEMELHADKITSENYEKTLDKVLQAAKDALDRKYGNH